jgi:hypothetical protein
MHSWKLLNDLLLYSLDLIIADHSIIIWTEINVYKNIS